MNYYNSMHELVGNTPLVKLNNMDVKKGMNIFAKLELYNPAGSVKDRVGIAMIEAAEKRGELKEGGAIVLGTAGNTGIGVAFAALGKGYNIIFVVPDKFSEEKQILMRALGAQVVNTPRELGMRGAGEKAEEIRQQIKGAVTLDQFTDKSNPDTHYHTTGKEIYEALDGKIDYIIAGAGSGGTYSGIMRYIKEKNPDVKGVLADPVGSVIGGGKHADYNIEGIGNDFIADTMDMSLVDKVIKVNDDEAIKQVKKLARREGIFAGTSSGAAMAAAVKLMSELEENTNVESANIVLVFPDRGDRYFSSGIYNDEIRISNALAADTDALYEIEALSFPPEKAAAYDAFVYRLKNFPQWFFKAEYNGKIVGLIDGSPSQKKYITDDLYRADGGYDKNGDNLLIFGLAVHPDFRNQGIAHKLMKHILRIAKEHGKKRVSLTCKESLITFYESFGYRNHGISKSVLGDVVSYDMEIDL